MTPLELEEGQERGISDFKVVRIKLTDNREKLVNNPKQQEKQVFLLPNGMQDRSKGKVKALGNSNTITVDWNIFLKQCASKLSTVKKLKPKRAFLTDGTEVFSVDQLQQLENSQLLYISNGEDFIPVVQ